MTIQSIEQIALRAAEYHSAEGSVWGSVYVRDVPPLLNIAREARGLIALWDESGDEYPDMDRIDGYITSIRRAISNLP